MTRLLLAAALAASPVFAQFTISALNGSNETQLDIQYSLGSFSAGDTVDTAFRIRNAGTKSAPLTVLQIAGSGFRLLDAPRVPQILPAGGFSNFTVRFQPEGPGSYSAALKADGVSIILLATVAPAYSISVGESGTQRTLNSGATIDFGSTERGTSITRHFLLANKGNQELPPAQVAVVGAGFRAVTAGPLTAGPGQSVPFDVIFQPSAAGTQQATLRIDRWSFSLRGAGTEPPPPKPAISLDLPTAESGRQGKVTVRLSEAARVSGSGRLQVDFRPALSGIPADPAIIFPATGNFSIPFTFAAGDTVARFGSQSAAEFQTGTTAGTILFTAQIGSTAVQNSVVIGAAPISVSATTASRGNTGIDIRVSGYDNTRGAGQLAFTFFDTSGGPISPGAIRVDASLTFQRYFNATNVGGMFALRAVFPVTGDAGQIGGVEVELANSAGTIRTGRIQVVGQ